MAVDDFDPSVLDPVMGVLLAALYERGLLDGKALTEMARRLDEADLPEAAHSVRCIPLSVAIDTPANRRRGMRLIDGGNDEA